MVQLCSGNSVSSVDASPVHHTHPELLVLAAKCERIMARCNVSARREARAWLSAHASPETIEPRRAYVVPSTPPLVLIASARDLLPLMLFIGLTSDCDSDHHRGCPYVCYHTR